MKHHLAGNSIGCLLCAVLLLASSAVHAQCAGGSCQPNTVAHAAVVRVVNAVGRARWYGSGTLIQADSQRSTVLTCAHLFPQGAGSVSVVFADASSREARVVAMDRAWDLAALEIAPSQAAPVTIAADAPQQGEPLTSCGYGPDGRYWCNQGRALGYVRTAAASSFETLELSGSARDGDSGGPILNRRGELVAVLWGTDGRTVAGTYCGRVRKFLSGILGRGAPLPTGPGPLPDAPALVLVPGATPPAAMAPPHGDGVETLRQRIDRAIELAAALQGRMEKAEAVVGGDQLRAIARESAAGLLADRAPGLVGAILPALLAALGWTCPPAAAAIVVARLAASLWRRRADLRPDKAARGEQAAATPAKPLDDDYAEQLARVYALSGRSPIADATLGREYDEELRQAAESSEANLARWARSLRDRVAQRFYRIHGNSPLPAEPPERK